MIYLQPPIGAIVLVANHLTAMVTFFLPSPDKEIGFKVLHSFFCNIKALGPRYCIRKQDAKQANIK